MLRLFRPALAALTMLTMLQSPPLHADLSLDYQPAPKAIRDILDAPATPSLALSPTRDRVILVQGVRYPPIADLAQPWLALAGSRINPKTNGPHRPSRVIGYTIKTLADGALTPVAIPDDAHLSSPIWSYDGQHFAFMNTTSDGIELWLADATTGQTRRINGIKLNTTYGGALQWSPGSASLLALIVVPDRGQPPAAPLVPRGPIVQESSGQAAPVRTYQDLLQNAHDEALFEYYCTSQLVRIDTATLKVTPIGKPALIASVDVSPDGNHLLVETTQRPYSYLHPSFAFPHRIEVWDSAGKVTHEFATIPLADRVPIEGVRTGPRSVHWHAAEPATLVWASALDEGDPKKKVPHRDQLLFQPAPFTGEKIELTKLEHRFAGITYGPRDGAVLVRDYDRDRRWIRTQQFSTQKPGQSGRIIWDRSINDRYGDPGSPITQTLPNGQRVLWQHGDHLFLSGGGATPKGDRPFLDRFNLTTLESTRLFQCGEGVYEFVAALLNEDGTKFLTRRESPVDPPNFLMHEVGKPPIALTQFTDPAPQLRGISQKLVTYKRDDGVQLSFTLYLPAGPKEGTRLPTLVWAYPREYTDAATAGQITGSDTRFTMIGGSSHLFLLTQGYAILDAATVPVVGDPETMNNTYVEQIVSGAKAAIDKAVELGVTDPDRVGAGGHSYGAFMTANLMAHSDLFRAGIARSGAYNRTLTPFGFQSERRTLWEAPEIYMKVSPFMVAHKINEPLLMIHGEVDNNPGTFPMQSERLYQAIRGNGGTARLVMLPHESHGYVARESIEHTLYEMTAWFDKYVKNAAPRNPRK